MLGTGGTGEVYAAVDEKEGRDVALKILHPYVAANALARFERESRVTASLGSPHIVKVYGLAETQEGPALILERLEGESLDERLARSRALPPDECLVLVEHCALGLGAAHAAGVVHRDLKPANIFLARSESPFCAKLLDFGASKVHGSITRLTHEHGLIGTPLYMAPEQARGRAAQVGAASDLFALAAVTYHALTGRPPFDGESLPALLHEICHCAPLPPSRLCSALCPDVDLVLFQALCKDPRARQRDVSQFFDDLSLAVRGSLPHETRHRIQQLVDQGAMGSTAVEVPGAPGARASTTTVPQD